MNKSNQANFSSSSLGLGFFGFGLLTGLADSVQVFQLLALQLFGCVFLRGI